MPCVTTGLDSTSPPRSKPSVGSTRQPDQPQRSPHPCPGKKHELPQRNPIQYRACQRVRAGVGRGAVRWLGACEPHMVRRRRRRQTDVDAVERSLCARGLTTEESSARFTDMCNTQVSNPLERESTPRSWGHGHGGVGHLLPPGRDMLCRMAGESVHAPRSVTETGQLPVMWPLTQRGFKWSIDKP